MALNAANIVVALGQEYGLDFVLEVLKIQFIGRWLSEYNRAKEKRKTKWNQNTRGDGIFFHSGPLIVLLVSAAKARIQQNTRPVRDEPVA
jgi:hypothetical protein